MPMSKPVRTRFAPSPTGYLHVGGARTALFNWLYARQQGGQFILRVEDTDEERNTTEARDAIFSGMRWLGMEWDEGPDIGGDHGPYDQSKRTAIYDDYFQKLVDADRVYEKDGAWWFRFDRKPITMHDLVCGEVTIDYTDESNTPDMVVKRSNGGYVFHFVNVVDDLTMGMTHVFRGEDHLMNTPKHLQLFEAFGAEPPVYGHIPLILNQDGSKMSKRDAGAAVGSYPEQGFLPEAVVNFLALLGWSPKDESEIFSTKELVDRFSMDGVNRSPAKFDIEKCGWVNQQHLLQLSPEAFATVAEPEAKKAGLPITEHWPVIAASVQEKVRLLTEVPQQIGFFYNDEFPFDEAAIAKVAKNEAAGTLLGALAEAFDGLNEWSGDTAKAAISETAKANGVKPGQLMFPTRVALSGLSGGPDLSVILDVLGKEKAVQRLTRCVSAL